MIALVKQMPAPVRQTTMVQEQLGFALNRAGRGEEAEAVLLEVIKTRGPTARRTAYSAGSTRTGGASLAKGSRDRGQGVLEKAIDAYLRGFEADWRDHIRASTPSP